MHVPLSDLPDSARVWVYASDAPLTGEQVELLTTRLASFLDSWSSHGRVVRGSAEIRDGRFLLLAADVPDGDLSGCGIDASVHAIESLGASFGIGWLTGLHILYRDASGTVRSATRPAFRALVRDGHIVPDTPVFTLTPESLGLLRSEGIERPARTSWHARVFRIPETA